MFKIVIFWSTDPKGLFILPKDKPLGSKPLNFHRLERKPHLKQKLPRAKDKKRLWQRITAHGHITVKLFVENIDDRKFDVYFSFLRKRKPVHKIPKEIFLATVSEFIF